MSPHKRTAAVVLGIPTKGRGPSLVSPALLPLPLSPESRCHRDDSCMGVYQNDEVVHVASVAKLVAVIVRDSEQW